MNKKKQIYLFLVLSFILIFSSSCQKTEQDTEAEKAKLAEIEKQKISAISDMEKIRYESQKEAGIRHLKHDLERLKKSSFYAIEDALLYFDENMSGDSSNSQPVEHKAEVIVKLDNSVSEPTVYEVKSIDGEVVEGYMKAEDLLADRFDFISQREEKVSYDAFEKNIYEDNPPIKMRGLFVSEYYAAGSDNLEYLMDIARTTDINAFIIDVKDDSGNLLFPSDTGKKFMPEKNENATVSDRERMKAIIKKLKDENIYLVARIVCFKSPGFAKAYPEKAIVHKGTNNLFMHKGTYWASPYDRDLWEYNIAIAEEAADMGFNEIQFDYVRFPATSGSQDKGLDFHNDKEETKSEAIHHFLKEAYARLSKKHVYLTADFFGYVATAYDDQNIGQHWETVVNVVDYSAPMVYPSHYGENNFGLPVPDAQPYKCIDGAMKDAIDRNKNLYTPAKLRPWIQDFTAPWVDGYINYGKAEVEAQIQALKDNGIDEYMVWNAANSYTKEAFNNDKKSE